MQYIIGLDLSTACTGFSKFDLKGNLLDFQKIKPKTTLTTLEKISFVMWEINNIFSTFTKDEIVERVIIEDIYLGNFAGFNQVRGFATLARLSGAVVTAILFATNKEVEDVITIRSAVQARPLVGLKGNCQKAEVQKWVLDKFTKIDTEVYSGMIDTIQGEKLERDEEALSISDKKEKASFRKRSNAKYKRDMLKISKMIEKETDYGEDISDAILLGSGKYERYNK